MQDLRLMPETQVNQLKGWWALIAAQEPERINDVLMPLSHLWGCQELVFSPADLEPDLEKEIEVEQFAGSLPDIHPDEASFKGVTQAILLGLRMNLYAGQNSAAVLVWAEKLMRYCEIYLPSLRKRALDKWVSMPQARLGMLHLAAFLLDVYFSAGDLRYLNTVLKLLDLKWVMNPRAVSPGLKSDGNYLLTALFQFRLCLLAECAMTALNVGRVSIPADRAGDGAPPSEHRDITLADSNGRVVVFSPSRYSLYTITVTELLLRQGVDVAALVVRRLTDPKRFSSEFRRDGVRLLRKIHKKLFLRERAYSRRAFETIVDLMNEKGILVRNLDELGKQRGIPVRYVKDLNDLKVVELLDETQPDLVVFTGGGLIRLPVLDSSGAGVLNCHAGILPPYRGMDVIEWAILEGNPDQVGITVHFMDKGVDTGDILRTMKVAIDPVEGLGQIRDRFEPLMCRELASACVDFLQGRLERRPQHIEDGRQYFIMHPYLLGITSKKLTV